jgi:hypothetical protein
MSAVGAKVITPVRVASERKAEGEQHGAANCQQGLDRAGLGPSCRYRAKSDSARIRHFGSEWHEPDQPGRSDDVRLSG